MAHPMAASKKGPDHTNDTSQNRCRVPDIENSHRVYKLSSPTVGHCQNTHKKYAHTPKNAGGQAKGPYIQFCKHAPLLLCLLLN